MSYKFVKKEHTVKIITGETTCASAPGEFCRFFATKNFGCTAFCVLFNTDLKLCEETGVTLRCNKCIDELK